MPHFVSIELTSQKCTSCHFCVFKTILITSTNPSGWDGTISTYGYFRRRFTTNGFKIRVGCRNFRADNFFHLLNFCFTCISRTWLRADLPGGYGLKWLACTFFLPNCIGERLGENYLLFRHLQVH